MAVITDALYERFKTNLEAVSGKCVRTSKADLAKTLADLFKEAGLPDVCIQKSPILEEADVAKTMEEAGITVYTDHIRLHAETAKGGISENQYGIADLGTLVQVGDDVDGRITGTMSEDYFGVVKGSTILAEYDDMFDVLAGLDEMPPFVGFVTGPSRTADIECVSTVGVHGPLRLTAIVVDDE